jgi:hypothetical protein
MPSQSKAGFDKNPQNINKKGRPKKDESMTKILESVMQEYSVNMNGSKILAKEAIARKALEIALKGDVTAIKYLYDRLDGTPKQTQEISGPNGGPIAFQAPKQMTLDEWNEKFGGD